MNRKSEAPTGRIRRSLSPTYSPSGALLQKRFGGSAAAAGGLFEQWCYNTRLQPTGIRVGATADAAACLGASDQFRLAYDYGTTDNNGNIRSQTIQQGTFSTVQSYNYDGVNRITDMIEQGTAVTAPVCTSSSSVPCQHYTYDQWGNRIVPVSKSVPTSVFEPTLASDVSAATNRLTLNGSTYDSAGNLKTIGGFSWDYNAENLLTGSSFTVSGSTSSQSFTYDAEGHRVKKGSTVFVYDAFGHLAAEYGGATVAAGTQYFAADHLGSTRAVIDGATLTVSKRMDYLPFGATLPTGYGGRPAGTYESAEDATNPRQRFTGKERDAETGLDYFGARYFSGAQGRFTTPDEFKGGIVDAFTGQDIETNTALPYADITDPQTLNKYAYVRNNPLRFTDPTGHCPWCLVLAPEALTGAAWVAGAVGATGVAVVLHQNSDKISAALSDAGRAIKGLILNENAEASKAPPAAAAPGKSGEAKENTNPYAGPVTRPVTVVDDKGNAIPVKTGEQVQGSKDGRYVQVKDAKDNATGTRIDGGHKPSKHPDPRAQKPHAHVPGVTNPDGTPWLPINK